MSTRRLTPAVPSSPLRVPVRPRQTSPPLRTTTKAMTTGPNRSTNAGEPLSPQASTRSSVVESQTLDSLFRDQLSGGMRSAVQQEFNFFLVIDFQATCEVHTRPQPEPREIIEVSVAKVNSKNFTVDAMFHQYVCPRVNKRLTKFCTQLTGISQCMVDGQQQLEPTLRKLHVWLHEQNLFKPGISFAVVTHNEWLLKQLLPRNIYDATNRSSIPEYFRKWINLNKEFHFRVDIDPTDDIDPLSAMLKTFDLYFEGPRHSGMYVCHNIVQIMRALVLRKQAVFTINSS